MALTISVGFVVDDAIVMLENIVRHIEEGVKPFEAAFKGAGEIGFTIVSISVSLVAVFIPLLLMGGIIGRLFREFAVTVTMTIAVSAFVSLTLTPMMASRFLKPEDGPARPPLPISRERGFEGMLRGYERGLDVVLRHQLPDAPRVLRHAWRATGYLFVIIPKGFFPQQDTGLITGTSEAAQDISFADMMRAAGGARRHRRQRSGGRHACAMAIGAGGSTSTINNGRFFITLKPRDERDVSARPDHRPPAAAARRRSRAPACSCRRRRTSTSAAGQPARSSSTPCRTPTSTNSTPGRRSVLEKLEGAARNCATSPATSRRTGRR